jgi:hypothetical protein
MKSVAKPEAQEKRPRSKKDFIYWEGGVKFGGFMALITAVADWMMHPERYYPLWPLTTVVAFSWLWALIVHPIIFFGAGCLFGLIMWALFGRRLHAEPHE